MIFLIGIVAASVVADITPLRTRGNGSSSIRSMVLTGLRIRIAGPPAPSGRETRARMVACLAGQTPTVATPAAARFGLTLYFGDATGTLYVAVRRSTLAEGNQVARAAIRELLAGPRGGLTRLIPRDACLLSVAVHDGLATANFDRRPAPPGDDRGLWSIVLTLTEFPTIARVQLQVNGENIGAAGETGPLARPVVNPLEPQSLPGAQVAITLLPLYFLSADGVHDVCVNRLVSKTDRVIEQTMEAMIDGPGAYSYALQQLIPAGTRVRRINLTAGTLTIDFTRPFADAGARKALVRDITLSMTAFDAVKGVQIEVEGRPLGELWGSPYGDLLRRPVLNPD